MPMWITLKNLPHPSSDVVQKSQTTGVAKEVSVGKSEEVTMTTRPEMPAAGSPFSAHHCTHKKTAGTVHSEIVTVGNFPCTQHYTAVLPFSARKTKHFTSHVSLTLPEKTCRGEHTGEADFHFLPSPAPPLPPQPCIVQATARDSGFLPRLLFALSPHLPVRKHSDCSVLTCSVSAQMCPV